MRTSSDTPAAITITAGKGDPPTAYYEAVWHEPQPSGRTKPAKQRIGKAWLDFVELDGSGRPIWAKRRGRVAEGFYDERRAHAAAPTVIAQWRERQAALFVDPSETVTVRELAHEWLGWLRDVKGASPATVRDYELMLREPGAPARRGVHRSKGRLMAAFGDCQAVSVSVRKVSDWLRALDREALAPKTVNKHRQLLSNLYTYAMRPDTYSLASNPVVLTDKRREPAPARLEYYEIEEVEALARAAEQGAHRKPRGRARSAHSGPVDRSPLSRRQCERQEAEQRLRAEQDRQDGELFRVMLYSGMRIGEARALRIIDVAFLVDLGGAVLDVRQAFSAGQLKPPKSWKPRQVPVARPGAEALARVLQRDDFLKDEDYVFVNRTGGPLDDSSIRRRYHAARETAGLRYVTLHGLRHAAGTIITHGAGLLTARDILGHAQVSTTNRYLHTKVDKRAIDAVNAAFGVAV